MEDEKLKSQAKETIINLFNTIPFASLEELGMGGPDTVRLPDMAYWLAAGEKTRKLFIEISSSGQPKPVRNAVNQLLRTMESFPDACGLIAAPYISPRAMAICEEAGLGAVDFAGNALISCEPVFIRIEGNSNPFRKDRGLRSLYSPKASRILRVLLSSSAGRVWKVEELKKEADVSIGLVSNMKKLLDEREWIKDHEAGISLSDPEALLREWSENYSFRKNRTFDFYTMKSLTEIEAAISEAENRLGRIALTGFSAAARMAPAVRYRRVSAYVEPDIENTAKLLDLKKVDSGANITLLEPYDEGVFYKTEEVDGNFCVSPVQAYLDLKGFRGRGEEAAEMLLEQVIKKLWL